VKGFDAYVKSAVIPLSQTCDDLGGLQDMGKLLQDAFEGVRTIIVLASRSKAPQEDLAQALTPHLERTQNAVKQIRDLKLDRDWDRHHKAIMEMLTCVSWVYYKSQQQLPATFVKEVLGSTEFWSNKLRKEFKGKDDKQIAFCDNLKKLILELSQYIQEYHNTGLAFNPKGLSLAEAAIRLSDEPVKEPEVGKSPIPKRHPTLGAGGGNIAGLMGELTKRKNAEGSSAATGLRKVSNAILYPLQNGP